MGQRLRHPAKLIPGFFWEWIRAREKRGYQPVAAQERDSTSQSQRWRGILISSSRHRRRILLLLARRSAGGGYFYTISGQEADTSSQSHRKRWIIPASSSPGSGILSGGTVAANHRAGSRLVLANRSAGGRTGAGFAGLRVGKGQGEGEGGLGVCFPIPGVNLAPVAFLNPLLRLAIGGGGEAEAGEVERRGEEGAVAWRLFTLSFMTEAKRRASVGAARTIWGFALESG
ncbi:hypothetical protein MHYP_G00144300 [Metynnis hypsauchen]